MLCHSSDTHILLNNVCITSVYNTESAHGTLCNIYSNRCHNEVTNSSVVNIRQEYVIDFQTYYVLQYKYVFIRHINKSESDMVISDANASVVVNKLFGINFYFRMYYAFVNKKYYTQMHSYIVKKRTFGRT